MALTRTFDFSILGGGIGGCISALRLADAGYKIQLIDQNTLLSGSSKNTACRLGLGLHYAHLKTALQYLNATIKFVRAHPGFAIGDKQTSSGSSDSDQQKNLLYVSQHVQYFIAKDSLFSTSEISTIQEALKAEYEKLVKADAGNQVFGKPSGFYRALTLAECKDVNPDEVTAGFKAAEKILDWGSFQSYLTDKILKHPNIEVIENTKISNISYSKEGYVFQTKKRANQEEKNVANINSTKRLILAAWQNNEWLLNALGFPMNPGSRINRAKFIAVVKLPSEFHTVPSMFFCSGPFASFTNHGDGTGVVSYEPVTNIEQNEGLVLNDLSKRLIEQGATEEEIQKYGKAILEGAKKYIPGIEKSEVIGAKIGIVKIKKDNGEWIRVIEKNDRATMPSNTNPEMSEDKSEDKKDIKSKISWKLKDALHAQADIYNKHSDIHERSSFGVEEYGLFLNANSCNKLLYCEENADLLLQSVKKQILLEKEFDVFIDNTISQLVKPTSTETPLLQEEKANNFKHVVTANLSRLVKSSDPQALGKEQCNNFANQIVGRAKLINQLNNFRGKLKPLSDNVKEFIREKELSREEDIRKKQKHMLMNIKFGAYVPERHETSTTKPVNMADKKLINEKFNQGVAALANTFNDKMKNYVVRNKLKNCTVGVNRSFDDASEDDLVSSPASTTDDGSISNRSSQTMSESSEDTDFIHPKSQGSSPVPHARLSSKLFGSPPTFRLSQTAVRYESKSKTSQDQNGSNPSIVKHGFSTNRSRSLGGAALRDRVKESTTAVSLTSSPEKKLPFFQFPDNDCADSNPGGAASNSAFQNSTSLKRL